jgi:ankyrin repeat protein
MIKSLDQNFRREVFTRYKLTNEDYLPFSRMKTAISACGRDADEHLTNIVGPLSLLQGSKGLSFEEFESILLKPSHLEFWASTLSLPQILAICLSRNDRSDDLKEVAELNDDSINGVVSLFAKQLSLVLKRSVEQLKEAMRQMSAQLTAFEGGNGKFVGFLGGNVDDFYQPLTTRLGWPNPQFESSMENEHRVGLPFKEKRTGNTICPGNEYDYVVRPDCKCPLSKASRTIPRIEDLLESQEAGLAREEVIALVLYTGPMFDAYNTALRNDEPENRSYSTTIFVLASAIVKLTKVQKISCSSCLYRGLGGDVMLPEYFSRPDARGRKGLTEFGFLSTTRIRDIAVQYSGAGRGMPIPTIFEIEVGSVSRGANIQAFSQYPREEECLWLPGTFLEPIGEPRLVIEKDSVVMVYRVRAESNLKVMTIDEYIEARRGMHLDSFDRLIHDVKQSLEENHSSLKSRLSEDISLNHNKDGEPVDEPICNVAGFIKKVIQQCKNVREIQSLAPLSDFALDTQLLKYALCMLDTAKMARSKVLGYLEDSHRRICFDLGSSLKTCHRERISFLWRSLLELPQDGPDRIRKARELCFELGLLTVAAIDCDLDHKPAGERRSMSKLLEIELGLVEDDGNEDDDGIEPRLVSAAADGRPTRDLLLLIAAGANLNGRDKEGSTPIFAAARYGHEDCLRLLLDQKADMFLRNKKGESPLYKAVQSGQSECLRMLIEARADVRKTDKEGMTPAWVAAQRGRHEMLRTLSRAGAELDVADSFGDSPVLAAAHAGHELCVAVLIELAANIRQENIDGFTPLMMAAQEGHDSCVKLLLAARADVEAQTKDGWSVMHGAAIGGRADSAECLDMLHKCGAGLHASFTQTMTNSEAKPEESEDVSDRKTQSAADVTVREEGFTPLMMAAGLGRPVCVAYLLEARAEVNALTGAGRAALHCAARAGSAECIKLLYKAGANLHYSCRDSTSGVLETAEEISAREGQAASSKEDAEARERHDACTALLRTLADTGEGAEHVGGTDEDKDVRPSRRRRFE